MSFDTRPFAILAVLLWTSVTQATASDFTPVPGVAPPKMQFDAAAGFFQEWKRKVECPINAVRTVVRMDVARHTAEKYYNANAGVFLFSGRLFISVQVIARHSAKPPFRILFRKALTRGNELIVGKPEFQLFGKRVSPGEQVAIALDWTADGRVTVGVGSEERSFDFGMPVDALKFGAAHSVSVFDPILVGYTGTEKEARAACKVIALRGLALNRV